jgi:hypothetical protein
MTETHNVDELRQACYAIIRALAEIVDHLDTQEATLDHKDVLFLDDSTEAQSVRLPWRESEDKDDRLAALARWRHAPPQIPDQSEPPWARWFL